MAPKFNALKKTVAIAPIPAFLLAVTIPLLLCVFWHLINNPYPSNDAAVFINGVMPLAQILRRGDWSTALSIFYWQRCWKPVILPTLLVPFLSATGDVRLSVACFNLIAYAAFLTYLFRFLKRYLSPPAAILVTWYTGTLPWTLLSMCYFMCELPFMAAGMASLFYLFENEGFESQRSSVLLGISLATAFCIQPFVALITIGFVYSYFIWLAVKAGKLRVPDIATAIIMGGFVIGVPWLFNFYDKPAYLFSVFAAWFSLVGMAFYLKRRGFLSTNFLWTQTIFLSAFLICMAPFYKDLYAWAFMSTYGGSTSDVVSTVKRSFWTRVCLYTRTTFSVLGVGGLYLFLLAAICRWICPRAANPIPQDKRLLRNVSGLLLVSLFLGILTFNLDVRYHLLGFTFLYILLIIGIAKVKKARWALFLLFLGHAVWIVKSVTGETPRPAWMDYYFNSNMYEGFYEHPLVPAHDSDAHRVLLKRISDQIDLNRPHKIFLLIQSYVGLPDPNKFYLMAGETGYKAFFDAPYDLARGNWKDPHFNWQKGDADYILIGLSRTAPFTEDMQSSLDLGAMANWLISLWKTKGLQSRGLTPVASIPFEAGNADFLIIKIDKSVTRT